ncbi:MAG: malonyl-ACP O-methyltransferase BioC [gamma proteobacterium endosymbiont of Lamellibrachia anaximandri]|nr:malonyl-ACP O-methyltransferase BioC [gamma proteobacterium endosymbiont of Lamellibrachia anaximandri]
MSPNSAAPIDKRQARRAFERSAASYDEVAVLQRDTARRMLERLSYIRHQPSVVLDVGAGTGEATAALAKQYRKARILALDFALPMLQQTRKRGSLFRRPRCLCADAEQLPLADQSVDLLFSNAALQWCNNLEQTFNEFLRVLRPNGLLMFSTFGPDTLKELRQSWAEVDGYPHVSPFPDMHDIGDVMLRAGFSDPVVDVDRMQLTYEDVPGLMRDLKALGAHNVTRGRQQGLTGKGRLQAMFSAYEVFRNNGRLPASYEVVYGLAWAPRQRTQDGVTSIPFDSLKQSL